VYYSNGGLNIDYINDDDNEMIYIVLYIVCDVCMISFSSWVWPFMSVLSLVGLLSFYEWCDEDNWSILWPQGS